MSNKTKAADKPLKTIHIVGTGIAGALIAKTLTDCVYDKNNSTHLVDWKIILRSEANAKFKKRLHAFSYFEEDTKGITIVKKFFEADGVRSKVEDVIIESIVVEIDQLYTHKSTEHDVEAKELFYQHHFERLYFNHFFEEIAITMYEAGLNEGVKLDSTSNLLNYNSYMQRFNKASAKVPNSPYPKLKQADSPNVVDLEKIPLPNPSTKGYLVQKGPLPFLSDHIRVGGGTTMHWLGTTPRMLTNDFNLQAIVDQKYFPKDDNNKLLENYYQWPLDYNELRTYYEIAELEIGVSGNVETQKYPSEEAHLYYGVNYKFPMEEIPPSYMDTIISKGLKEKTIKLDSAQDEFLLVLSATPQGRNSNPNKNYKKEIQFDYRIDNEIQYSFSLKEGNQPYKSLGAVWNPYMGERCEGNASCVPICPVQAKYNALKSLKKAVYKEDWKGELKPHKQIEIKGQAVAYKLGAANGKQITSIHLRCYEAQNKTSFTEELINTSNDIVVLAANALENPKILLNSTYKEGEQEYTVANKSDQVGRNLMDHQVMLTWGLAKESVYPFRGPGSTTNIATFRDGPFRKEHAAWITPLDNWGWGWPTFAPATNLEEALKEGKFGYELRAHLKEKVTRQVLFHFEIEQLPNPDNRITISDTYLDVLGIPRPIINYSVSEYELKALEQAKIASDQMFEILEITDYTTYSEAHDSATTYKGKLYNFNGAGHIVGTHRMGIDAATSVTNSYCQSWEHKNLYVVGAGSMVTLGTSNPTLTLAAIAIRSVESILTDLKK